MRCIGIIGAMDDEVAGLKEYMQDVKVTSRASMDFYEGILEGRRAVVVRSGIGKVNAAVCAQILVDEFRAEVIINTGIAGSLNNEINIGDIVVSTDLVQHDMNAVAFGYPAGQIPQMDAVEIPLGQGKGPLHLKSTSQNIHTAGRTARRMYVKSGRRPGVSYAYRVCPVP